MNDEEKKSIEWLKSVEKYWSDKNLSQNYYATSILNLIEKQEKEIEGYKCLIETQTHNEEVYEKLVEKLKKEIKELKTKYDLATRNNNFTIKRS